MCAVGYKTPLKGGLGITHIIEFLFGVFPMQGSHFTANLFFAAMKSLYPLRYIRPVMQDWREQGLTPAVTHAVAYVPTIAPTAHVGV